MADIQKDEIKLMASQVLADTEDGGGQMTSDEIVDGNVNNLFPDISRLDRTYGRVSLRKAYLSVQTDNRATYYGAHVALTEQAADPLVSTTLFTTENWFDVRQACRDRIEAYLVKGPFYSGTLWANHYSGSRQIKVLTRENNASPEIGDVLVLETSKSLSGGTIAKVTQYVRITSVVSELEEFEDSSGLFYRKAITLNIGQELEHDFPGASANRHDDYSNGDTMLFTTNAADTSRYYGVTTLAEDVSEGDLTIRAQSIKMSIVPSSTSQTPLTDFDMGLGQSAVVGGGGYIEKDGTLTFQTGSTTAHEMGGGIKPGTLTFGDYTDDGKGNLINSAGDAVGSILYTIGTINTISASSSFTITDTFSFIPAVELPCPTSTDQIYVDINNRGYVFVYQMPQIPVTQTFKVSFLSDGKWYSLYDLGDGEIKGSDSSIGSGVLNMETGSVALTLGGMPDVDSVILLSWTPEINTRAWGGDPEDPDHTLQFTVPIELPNEGINPGSLIITWFYDGDEYTATDAAGDGKIIGDVADDKGFINYTAGTGEFKPINSPPNDTDFGYSYSTGDLVPMTDPIYTVTAGSPFIIHLNNTSAIEPRSIAFNLTFSFDPESGFSYTNKFIREGQPLYGNSPTTSRVFEDDGAGNIICVNSGIIVGSHDDAIPTTITITDVTVDSDYVLYTVY